jgi:hypothetical protein
MSNKGVWVRLRLSQKNYDYLKIEADMGGDSVEELCRCQIYEFVRWLKWHVKEGIAKEVRLSKD